MKKPTIYLDMDGVLADFNTAARELIRATKAEQRAAEQSGRWPEHQWRQIADQQNFYRILPKMPQADDLVALALKFRDNLDYDIKILTAIPHNNDMHGAFHDKVDWIAEHYGQYGFRVHFGPYSEDKQHHCTGPDDILVDDRTSNCSEWRLAGGTAVQVREAQYQQALDELEELFQSLMALTLI
jgi:5'(3')-deoxyribonucleotidase